MLTEGKEQSQKPKYLLSLLSLKERWQVLNIWYDSASLVKYFSHALMSLWDKLHAGETKQTVFEVKKKKKDTTPPHNRKPHTDWQKWTLCIFH